MDKTLTVYFDSTNKTLYITGNGEINWKKTVMFSEVAERVVIEGNGVYCTNASNLFANFHHVLEFEGTIDTSKCTDFSFFYSGCDKLIKPITNLDTSAGEEFDFFHNDNHALSTASFNTTHCGSKFLKMFYHCESLTTINGLSVPSTYDIETISDNPFVVALLSRTFKENVVNG